MPATLDFFKVSKLQLPAQLGRVTLHQAAETSDAISAVKVCCLHAFQMGGYTLPDYYSARLDHLNGKLTLAQAGRVLTTWKKWTWADDIPTAAHCEGFVRELAFLA